MGFLACSVQLTFCKSVLNITGDHPVMESATVGEDNEMNRAIAIGSIHPPAVRGKRSVVDENIGEEPLSCFTVNKHGHVVIGDMRLTLDQLIGLGGLDGKDAREEYEECEKRGKNKHEV